MELRQGFANVLDKRKRRADSEGLPNSLLRNLWAMTRACGRILLLCSALRCRPDPTQSPQKRQDRDIAPAVARDLRRGAFVLRTRASL